MNEARGPALEGSQTDRTAQEYIAGRVKAGASNQAIVQELIQRGYDPSIARQMVGGVSRQHASTARQNGLFTFILGLGLMALSLAITIGSYTTASQQGGTYFICYGAILFGLVLAIRGLLQVIRGREVK